MKKLLLTGFEPFLDYDFNPTEMIVNHLNGKQIGEYKIEGYVLPVDYHRASRQLLEYFHAAEHDAVITLGMAAGRECITPERIAINIKDGTPDNDGYIPRDELIEPEGADGYFSTLPIRKMVNDLLERGFPSKVSNTAGAYLCNQVMYVLLHELRQSEESIPAGFVHIPASLGVARKSSDMPAWPVSTMQEGIETIIKSLNNVGE